MQEERRLKPMLTPEDMEEATFDMQIYERVRNNAAGGDTFAVAAHIKLKEDRRYRQLIENMDDDELTM